MNEGNFKLNQDLEAARPGCGVADFWNLRELCLDAADAQRVVRRAFTAWNTRTLMASELE